MGYSTGTLKTSQTLFGSVAWSRKFDFLVDLEASLFQLGVFETDLTEGRASARPGRAEARPFGMRATRRLLQLNRLALNKLSDEVF